MTALPISCVIPVRGSHEGLLRTLSALRQQTRPPAEVVVVWDDAGPPPALRDDKPFSLRLIAGPRRGSYAARNAGARTAKQPWIFFLDADITFPENLLADVAPYLKTHEYVAILVESLPPRTFFEHYTAAYEFRFREWFRRYFFSGVMMIRREVFERLGGFDERLMSGGDHEFGRRCREHGVRQFFWEAVPAYHPPRGWRSWVRKCIRVEKGKQQLKARYPERFGFYSTGWRAWWDSTLRLGYALLAGHRQIPSSQVPLSSGKRWALAVMAAAADWTAKTAVALFPHKTWNV